MHASRSRRTGRLYAAGWALLALAGARLAPADDAAAAAKTVDHSAHQGHHAHQDAAPADALEVQRVLPAPPDFVGNVSYDAEKRRLLLTSWGPPANTKGPSFLYDVSPQNGEILRRAKLPLMGEFGGGAQLGDYLYHVVSYQSTLYKIDLRPESFGTVAATVKLPTLNDLRLDNDVYRFPYIAFTGVVAGADGRLILYAADLGELMVFDPASGELRGRVRTTKGLSGVTGLRVGGRQLLLGSFDPVDSAFRQETRRYMFRSAHGILPLETVRAEGNYGNPGQKTLTWVLLDPDSGEVLAATAAETTRLAAGSVAVVSRDDVPGSKYGRVIAMTTGDEGVLTVGWTPH